MRTNYNVKVVAGERLLSMQNERVFLEMLGVKSTSELVVCGLGKNVFSSYARLS